MSDLIPMLEPPPGGPARLHSRLAAEGERRRVRPTWVLVPAAAAVGWLLVARIVPPRGRPVEPVSRVAVGENSPVLARLPSSNPHVILYAVAPTEGLVASPQASMK